jgi:hypothetical protein
MAILDMKLKKAKENLQYLREEQKQKLISAIEEALKGVQAERQELRKLIVGANDKAEGKKNLQSQIERIDAMLKYFESPLEDLLIRHVVEMQPMTGTGGQQSQTASGTGTGGQQSQTASGTGTGGQQSQTASGTGADSSSGQSAKSR